MRYFLWFMMLVCSLTGCGELRVLGDAALRELRSEAITVNWISDESRKVEKSNEPFVNRHLTSRRNEFSSFRPDPSESKKPQKGLWEQHPGDVRVK